MSNPKNVQTSQPPPLETPYHLSPAHIWISMYVYTFKIYKFSLSFYNGSSKTPGILPPHSRIIETRKMVSNRMESRKKGKEKNIKIIVEIFTYTYMCRGYSAIPVCREYVEYHVCRTISHYRYNYRNRQHGDVLLLLLNWGWCRWKTEFSFTPDT